MNRKSTVVAALAVLCLISMVFAAQDSTITLNEVRDPRKLQTWLQNNASDAETRLAALGSTASSTMVLTNGSNAGACYIEMTADVHGDAGDRLKINFADGGTLTIGTDIDSKGTIATKLTMGATGILTMKGGTTLDNTTDTGKLTITETAVDVAGSLSANSLAIDAGAGVDAGSAGALKIGETTATSVDISKSGVTTTIKGTLQADETATFTAKSVHNAGIDADFITVDPAGGGIDCESAGALQVGLTTATSVDVGKSTKLTTVKGTFQVDETSTFTGVATFTAESVHNAGIDCDYVTVDAGYGVDVKSSGTLKLGEATANKVEISTSGVETEIQGTLNAQEAVTCDSTLTITGAAEADADVHIHMVATTSEITITQTNVTGATGVPLMGITDSRTGANANEVGEATISIAASGTYAFYVSAGATAVQALDADSLTVDAGYGIDTDASGTLKLAEATANAVEIAQAGVQTTVEGTLVVNQTVTCDTTLNVTQGATFNGDVAINDQILVTLASTDEEIVITQTNVTGVSATPLISITDNRTGANANENTEATIAIAADGTFAIYVSKGATELQALDCDSITVDAAAGIDVQSAGALKVGVTTATSIDYGSASVTAHTFTSDGTGTAEVVLPAGSIDGTEVLDATLTTADLSATAGILSSQLATTGDGTVEAAAASVSEVFGDLHKTTITFTNVVMVATDRSDEGESTKVYTFPAGVITILGATMNATATISAGGTNTSAMALGSAAAGDDSTLTGTEVNIIPSTSVGAVGANAEHAFVAAPVIIDGTAAAVPVYVNWAIDDDNMDANTTNTVTGTVTITWVNGGTY